MYEITASGIIPILLRNFFIVAPTGKNCPHRSLLNHFNIIREVNWEVIAPHIPKIWRKSRVVALLKPCKDPASPKSYRPISLLCHTYKLFERLIFNRVAPFVNEHLVPEQAGFRPGKSCTGQLLNLTQFIEDGYEEGLITGAGFVNLSAAYDTVNDRILTRKLFEITQDVRLTELIQNMLSNRRFFVDLVGKRSRWRRQKNGLPQGSVLAPLLFNIYTNDQPVHPNTRSFLYANDLCIATQKQSFEEVEKTLGDALAGLTPYYAANHLMANPEKTQISTFHLKNRDAQRELNVVWHGKLLTNSHKPVYLGVTLDRCLTYKDHIAKTKAKTGARNSILKKLANTNWGTDARTIRTTALALCFSSVEYASPVWSRSSHASKIEPVLNAACRAISGCLRPTRVDDLYLCGIAPPHIRRAVSSQLEKLKQENDPLHPLYEQDPARKRLKSRHSFLHSVEPLDGSARTRRLNLWSSHLQTTPRKLSSSPKESLPPGSSEAWPTWSSLNRLRTGTGRCKSLMQKWGFNEDGQTTCECGDEQTMKHLLVCPILPQPCTHEDLEEFNPRVRSCAHHWAGVV